jgi:hypothetical protein
MLAGAKALAMNVLAESAVAKAASVVEQAADEEIAAKKGGPK